MVVTTTAVIQEEAATVVRRLLAVDTDIETAALKITSDPRCSPKEVVN
jgi:hypothetical protein